MNAPATGDALAPYYADAYATLYHGDCLDVLARMAPESIESIVTDPPYGLSFMGHAWDHGVPGVPFWEAALRVLKPGAHLCAFGSARTHHRLMVAIEDAGFEIRDCLMWIYGQGYPKSLDVAKAIDKDRSEDLDAVRVVCRALRARMDARGLVSRDLVEHFGGCHPRLIDHWAARDTDSQPTCPTPEQWRTLCDVLELADPALDAEVARLNARKGERGDRWNEADVIGAYDDPQAGGVTGKPFAVRDSLIRAPSEIAADWQGWGTALKPAWEPIILARKPLRGTVARNVLAYGTGGLNIGACQIEGVKGAPASPSNAGQHGWTSGDFAKKQDTDAGRWPANIVHDGSDVVVAAMPEAGGGFGISGGDPSGRGIYAGNFPRGDGRIVGYGDSGSAARFFYAAKSSPSDRAPYNTHPTVKPLSLMRWLVRLATPPGGTVLDMFAGSSTTLVAARAEFVRSIGVELKPEWCDIGRRRLGEAGVLPLDG